MFTGIIESIGKIVQIIHEDQNVTFEVQSPISEQLTVDQSVSHSGVCLTVIEAHDNSHKVTAVAETLKKTMLKNLKIGDKINLERCMPSHGRFDGHIVQGHVDTVAQCIHIENQLGSWLFRFEFDPKFGHWIVEKGSITINGISLTCFDVSECQFSVAIIPYTYENTNMQELQLGEEVNLEFDIIGKYVEKMMAKRFS